MKNFYKRDEYSIEDILKLIEIKADEGLYLEYKSAEALSPDKKTEISKDVSAFANSDGGVIIYGIMQDDTGRADKISFINNKKYSKDWLQQVIESGIQKRIPNITIQSITNPSNEEEHILAVIIEASSQAPHMASDKIYYKRTSKGNSRLEEYEVRQLYFRAGMTDLNVEIESTSGQAIHPHLNKPTSIGFTPSFYITNIGNSIEHNFKLEIGLPISIHVDYFRFGIEKEHYTHRHENEYQFITFHNTTPLFQSEKIMFTRIPFQITPITFNDFENGKLTIKLYSSSQVKKLEFNLVELFTFQNNRIKKDSMSVYP